MQRLPNWIVIVALALAITPVVAKADKVVLKNGDTISGTVVSADGGKLCFKSDKVGDLTIDMKDVQTFSTDAPVHLLLSDGTIVNEKVTAGAEGQVNIAPGGTLQPQAIVLANVQKINPPPVAWHGSITAQGQLENGNTNSEQFGIDANVLRRTDDDRITAEAAYNYGNQTVNNVKSTTANNWFATGKYDEFWTTQLYGYAQARVEHDQVQNLRLRLTPGVGIGYQWVEQPDFNFDTEGGIAWVYEDYSTLSSPNENFSVRLAYHLDKSWNDGKIKIFNDVQYFPSVQNASNYLILADAGVRMALTSKMYSELKAECDYDSNPGPGSKRTDTKLLVGLGWSF